MARGTALRGVGTLVSVRTGDPKVDRGQDQVVGKINQLVTHPLMEAVLLEVTLKPGLNKVPHSLKRPIRHFLSMANGDAALNNFQASNPHPGRELWVNVTSSTSVEAVLLLLPVIK
jgi:hypothetical protein